MAFAESLYRRLPLIGQNAAISSYGLYWRHLRFGGSFRHQVTRFRERERWDHATWQNWKQEQLRRRLTEWALGVPYYRSTWNRDEVRAARAGQLQDLPLLNKEPLRENPRAFVDPAIEGWPEPVFHTSGSTGTPLRTIWTVDELRASLAVREARANSWAGVSFQHPRATFSGRLVEPDPMSSGPYYRLNRVESQVYFSPFHLSPATASFYREALLRHHSQWLTGYAVSSYLLARFLLENDLEPVRLRAVITTSEKVTPKMKEVIEAGLGPVFEEYSTVENEMFACTCERGRLHVSEDVGIIEILDRTGRPSAAGEVGEVVATGLLRRKQPLVRFRLGDLAAWDPEPCPCGRALPVLREVVGRLEDVLRGPDGRQMVRFHGVFVDMPQVVEAQVVQETLERIRVRVVSAAGFDAATEADIRQRVRQRLGEVDVVVEQVASIKRSAGGKYRAVVSLLDASTKSTDVA